MNYKLFLCFLLCVGLTSCRRAAEKASEKIRIEEVERIEPHGLTGWDMVLRVRNDSGYKIKLEKVSFDVFFNSSPVLGIELVEPVEMPRHTTGSFTTRWNARICNPLALYVFARRIRQNDLSAASVSFAIEGRGGPASINISQEKMPLSDFLNTFGIDLQDMKNLLEQ